MGITEDMARLEQGLRELIIKYEQYFCGVEKREPLHLLEEVEQGARHYQNVAITNTMMKFKYQSLLATLGSHRQKWNRINRLIEDGKYSRDRFRMSLHQQDPDQPAPAAPAAPPSPLSEAALERLYQQFRAARQACRLPVDSLSREMIAAAIERQRPAILAKYRCSEVEFAVVVEDGKPRLKARPSRR